MNMAHNRIEHGNLAAYAGENSILWHAGAGKWQLAPGAKS